MSALTRISHVSIFLIFVFIVKSLLAIALRTSMAALFGAGVESDAYFAAFTVPQLLSDFFIGGILFAAIIPVLQQRRAEAGDETASKNVSALLNFSLLALALVTVVYCALVPLITPLLFPGFKGEKLDLTIRLSWIFAPSIILMGLSLIFTSFYHASRWFVIPSIAALVFPVSSLAALWLLPSSWGIERLVYGNILGYGIGIMILMRQIAHQVRWQWNWDFSNPLITSTLLLSWPVFIEGVFSRCVPLIQKSIASGLPEKGAITIIELAFFIVNAVVGVLSAPIATAIYPFWGQQNLENNAAMVFQSFFKAMGVVFFLAFPCMIILLTESYDIVKLVYGYGRFSESDCALTAAIISIVSIVVLSNCFINLAGRLYFVFNDTKTISLSTILIICASIPLYYIGASLGGIYGLMGAVTATIMACTAASVFILKLKHKSVSFRPLWSTFLKILLCASVMGAVVVLVGHLCRMGGVPIHARLMAGTTAGAVAYLAMCHVLRLAEYLLIRDRLWSMYGRRYSPNTSAPKKDLL